MIVVGDFQIEEGQRDYYTIWHRPRGDCKTIPPWIYDPKGIRHTLEWIAEHGYDSWEAFSILLALLPQHKHSLEDYAEAVLTSALMGAVDLEGS